MNNSGSTPDTPSPPSAVGSILIFILQSIVGVFVLLWAIIYDAWCTAWTWRARKRFEEAMEAENLRMIDARIAELRGRQKWEPRRDNE